MANSITGTAADLNISVDCLIYWGIPSDSDTDKVMFEAKIDPDCGVLVSSQYNDWDSPNYAASLKIRELMA